MRLTCYPQERYWASVSELAKEFIRTLVNPDPSQRPTAEEALRHPWLTSHQPDTSVDLSTGLRENWNSRKKWQSAMRKVVAANRFNQAGVTRSRRNTDASTRTDQTFPDSDSDVESHRSYGTANDHDEKPHGPPSTAASTNPNIDSVARGLRGLMRTA